MWRTARTGAGERPIKLFTVRDWCPWCEKPAELEVHPPTRWERHVDCNKIWYRDRPSGEWMFLIRTYQPVSA